MLNIIARTGEKPDELPLRAPTKFQLVVNVKAAKETGKYRRWFWPEPTRLLE
jgi:hypothetical protein